MLVKFLILCTSANCFISACVQVVNLKRLYFKLGNFLSKKKTKFVVSIAGFPIDLRVGLMLIALSVTTHGLVVGLLIWTVQRYPVLLV